MEGSRQGAFNELDEPKAAVGGPGTSAQGPGTSALPFVMPGMTQCVPIYWFRYSCFLIGILENSVIVWPIVTVRSEEVSTLLITDLWVSPLQMNMN